MAFTRKDGRKTIIQFGIGAELEAKLKKIGEVVEGQSDPSPELLADITLLGADAKISQLDVQAERIDGLSDRLTRLEEKVEAGLAAILEAIKSG